jgi:hypothetical protein
LCIFLEAEPEVNQVVGRKEPGEAAGAWHPAGRFGTDAMEFLRMVCVDAQMQGILERRIAGPGSGGPDGWVTPSWTVSRPGVSLLAWLAVGYLPGLPFW